MKKVEVVAAIVIHKDLILCTQRDKNKFEYISEKFEFPGGKIEYNETHQEAWSRYHGRREHPARRGLGYCPRRSACGLYCRGAPRPRRLRVTLP